MVKRRNQWNLVYEYCAPEARDKGISKEGDAFSLGAVFLEMLIVLDYPDKFESLKPILKRPCPSDGILSYANNIHQVHSWIEKKLDALSWQDNKIRSKCKEMI
ncbi:kinase-like domain-containing protein [Penicillium samsonianum]|uniref:kinase-like domain-containing protein n=1 Tax=Penicillium samsonianum TaxID=1882272 RepID=UPI002547AC49|nr:kinase-like domain-containing protein [Penicillium samsonianum]KAJ6126210.1 kinase-like domain-containing protein [Penicillium samsonianum]